MFIPFSSNVLGKRYARQGVMLGVEEGVSLCVGCFLWSSSLPSSVSGDCDTLGLAYPPWDEKPPLRHPGSPNTGGWGAVD